jgi:hypothetical protein
MVLCEAMLCGLPVITLSTPLRDNSQIEVVRHGETGLVVSNGGEFARAMMDLCGDERRRAELGARGPAWVKSQYSIAVVAASAIKLARLALASGSAAEFARNLEEDPSVRELSEVKSQRELLGAAGIPPSLLNSSLASAVNRPTARRAIRAVRAVQRWLLATDRGH